jgi:hypothetical protein
MAGQSFFCLEELYIGLLIHPNTDMLIIFN